MQLSSIFSYSLLDETFKHDTSYNLVYQIMCKGTSKRLYIHKWPCQASAF